MAISNLKASFSYDLKTVWAMVTSLDKYAWRSDLKKIEVLDAGKIFIEYTKDGYATTFNITAFEPYRKYAFEMENDNIKGKWIGIFSFENGITTVDFTEDVAAKKLLMKPFVGVYLKKQQAAYAQDLKRGLENLKK